MQAVMRAGLRYLPLLLLALAWEAGARFNLVDTSALPPLSKVAAAWIDLIRGGELIDNGKVSLYRGSVGLLDRKSTRLNSSHVEISYAVFCLKKKKKNKKHA